MVGLGRELGCLESGVFVYNCFERCTWEHISKLQQDFRLTHELVGFSLTGLVRLWVYACRWPRISRDILLPFRYLGYLFWKGTIAASWA